MYLFTYTFISLYISFQIKTFTIHYFKERIFLYYEYFENRRVYSFALKIMLFLLIQILHKLLFISNEKLIINDLMVSQSNLTIYRLIEFVNLEHEK